MSSEKKGNVAIADVSLEQGERLFPDFDRAEFKSMSHTAILLRNLFLPGKQLDMPEDNNHGFQVNSKTLYGHQHSVLTAHVQTLYSQKFMRLLSARHTNGFYIYSLEKLII